MSRYYEAHNGRRGLFIIDQETNQDVTYITDLLNQQDEEIKKLKKELFDLKNHKLDSIFYGFNDHLEKTIIDKMEIK